MPNAFMNFIRGGKIEILLSDFLQNPTGKNSSSFARRSDIIANLKGRFDKIKNNISYKIYNDGFDYLFAFKIPSESYSGLFYDVFLQFIDTSKKYKNSSTISYYPVHFASNSPHMMFTYTYVLYHENLHVDLLEDIDFYSKEAIKNRPKTTNPVETSGFEKSCYYAALYITEMKLTNKKYFEKELIEFNDKARKDLFSNIMTQEEKLRQYNTFKNKKSESKKKFNSSRVKKANSEHSKSFKNHDNKRQSSNSLKSNNKRQSSFKSLFKKDMSVKKK